MTFFVSKNTSYNSSVKRGSSFLMSFSTNSEISDGIPYFIVFLKFFSSSFVSSFSRAFSAFSSSIFFGRFGEGILEMPGFEGVISSCCDSFSALVVSAFVSFIFTLSTSLEVSCVIFCDESCEKMIKKISKKKTLFLIITTSMKFFQKIFSISFKTIIIYGFSYFFKHVV